MSRIATVKAYCADRHRLIAPRIVGGIENLRTISSITERMLPKLSVKAR